MKTWTVSQDKQTGLNIYSAGDVRINRSRKKSGAWIGYTVNNGIADNQRLFETLAEAKEFYNQY